MPISDFSQSTLDLIARGGAPPERPASDFHDCENPSCSNRIVKPNLLCSRCRQKLPYALKERLGSAIYSANADYYESAELKALMIQGKYQALAQCLEYLENNQ